MLTKIGSKGDRSSLGFLANWGALLEPLKLHPEECRLRASTLCGNNMGGGGGGGGGGYKWPNSAHRNSKKNAKTSMI